MNTIQVIGRCGRDPEVRQTSSGKSVANFSIAVDREWQKDQADWFQVSVWGEKQVEFVQKHVRKGKLVAVRGRHESEKKDNDGVTMVYWQIVADRVQPLQWDNNDSSGGGDGEDPFADI